MHEDGEISGGVLSELNLALCLEFSLASGRVSNLCDSQSLVRFVGLALTEAKQGVFGVSRCVSHRHVRKAGCVSFQRHRDLLLRVVELDMRQDFFLFVRVEANKEAPSSCCVRVVAHNLAIGELRNAVEYFLSGSSLPVGNVDVVNGVSADCRQFVGRDPPPVDHLLLNRHILQFFAVCNVQHLNHG